MSLFEARFRPNSPVLQRRGRPRILREASAYFATAELDRRPSHNRFIDEYRAVHGVEPICKVLPIAPSTYHAHVAKRRDPARPSARARQDAALKIEIVFDENFRVYGVRKVWRQLEREGFDIARCTVSRLMRSMDLQEVIRSKSVKTTISDKWGHARWITSSVSSRATAQRPLAL